jgi:hypothetical protein
MLLLTHIAKILGYNPLVAVFGIMIRLKSAQTEIIEKNDTATCIGMGYSAIGTASVWSEQTSFNTFLDETNTGVENENHCKTLQTTVSAGIEILKFQVSKHLETDVITRDLRTVITAGFHATKNTAESLNNVYFFHSPIFSGF